MSQQYPLTPKIGDVGDLRPLEAVLSAFGEAIGELSGVLVTRTAAAAASGDTELEIVHAEGFPQGSGVIAIGGEILTYSSAAYFGGDGGGKLFGLAQPDGTPGAAEAHASEETVYYIGPDLSEMAVLRASMLARYAVSDQLDDVGRNLSATRPLGASDSAFRGVIPLLAYGPKGTVYLLEQVLEELFGPGNWAIFEDPVNHPGVVFVEVGATWVGSIYEGKTFLFGAEAAASTTTTSVPTQDTPLSVSGVYLDTDPERLGTNYWNKIVPDITGGGGSQITSPSGPFDASMVGKALRLSGATPAENGEWKIASFIDANNVTLDGWDEIPVDVSGAVVTSQEPQFSPDMVGKIMDLGVLGAGTIQSVDSPYQATLTAALGTGTNLPWKFTSTFTSVGPFTAELVAVGTIGPGNVITLPTALPVPVQSVLVDYTTIESAQLLASEVVSNAPAGAYYPFYLWDATAVVSSLFDAITAAGVIPIVR